MFGPKLFHSNAFRISTQYIHVMSSYYFMNLGSDFVVIQNRSHSFCHCSYLVLQYYVSIQAEPGLRVVFKIWIQFFSITILLFFNLFLKFQSLYLLF